MLNELILDYWATVCKFVLKHVATTAMKVAKDPQYIKASYLVIEASIVTLVDMSDLSKCSLVLRVLPKSNSAGDTPVVAFGVVR